MRELWGRVHERGAERGRRRRGAILGAAVPAVFALVMCSTSALAAMGQPRSLAEACPVEDVPGHGFEDVSVDNVHAEAIACLVWWEVTRGVSAGRFDPAGTLTRGQYATFMHRVLVRSGAPLPSDPPDAFVDDDGSVHEPAIDTLSAVGVVRGFVDGNFHPGAAIRRDQLATLVVGGVEWLRGASLKRSHDVFRDDDGSVHERNLDVAWTNGILVGTGGGTAGDGAESGAALASRRDQAASVLARVLGLLVDEGLTEPPGGGAPGGDDDGSGDQNDPPDDGADPGEDGPDDPPGEDDEIIEGVWQFTPGAVVLAPGDDPVQVALVHIGGDGLPSGAPVPEGVTFSPVGDETISMDAIGPGTVEIDPGDAIGGLLVTTAIPDGEDGPVLSVTVAELEDGVQALTDDQILFPPADLPPGIDPAVAELPGIDAGGVGPFTWQELLDRTDVEGFGVGDLGPDDVIAPDGHHPLVLLGQAPAPGTLVLGTEGAAILGRVIEPTGLPTLERDGHSLITVELVDLTTIYAELRFDPCDVLETPDPTAAPYATADCLAPDGGTGASGLSMGPATVFSTQAKATAVTPQTAAASEAGVCDSSANVMPLDVHVQAADLDLKPFALGSVAWQERPGLFNDRLHAMQFEVGLRATYQATVTATLETTVDWSGSCELDRLTSADVPVPGPLAPLLSINTGFQLLFEFSLELQGGPRFSMGAGCTATLNLRAGFRHVVGSGTEDLSDAERPPPDCEPVFEVTDGVDASDSPLRVSADLGLVAQGEFGARAGGNAVGKLGGYLDRHFPNRNLADLGKATLLTVKVGPVLHVVWENDAQVLAAGEATSTVTTSLQGSAKLGLPPIEFLSDKVLGVKVDLEVTLVDVEILLQAYFRSLQPDTISVDVDGERQSEDGVEVSIGDTVDIEITFDYDDILIPPLFDAPVDDAAAWVIEPGDGGGASSRLDLFGSYASAGPTTVTASGVVTEEVCARVGSAGNTVAITGENRIFGLVPTAGDGGSFELRCGAREIRIHGTATFEPECPPDRDTEPFDVDVYEFSEEPPAYAGEGQWGGNDPDATYRVTPAASTEYEFRHLTSSSEPVAYLGVVFRQEVSVGDGYFETPEVFELVTGQDDYPYDFQLASCYG